nr:putative capsid protein [Picobirnavirus sp.]
MTGQTDVEKEVRGEPEHEGALGQTTSANNNNKRNNSNRNYYDKRKGKGKTTNDPSWYSKYPELLESSSNLNYSDPFGQPIKWKDWTDAGNHVYKTTSNTVNRAFPGVAAIKTKPSFGFNDNSLSPINVAANALYVNIRHKVSGRKNYDPVDVMLYMGAISEIYSFVNWAARAYAMAFTASQTNYYVMEGLAAAMQISLSSLRTNLSNFRMWLNSFIERVSAYAIPKGITYFDKKVSQYNYLYLENPDKNIKDQLYVYIPDGFFRFNVDGSNAGKLEYRKIGYGGPLSVNDIINIGEDLISTIWGDEDFGIMSGDMIKAYEGNIVGLSKIEDNAYLTPVYDESSLLQIKNATIVDSLDSTSGAVTLPTYTRTDGTADTWNPGEVVQNDKGLLLSYNSAYDGLGPNLAGHNMYLHQAKLMTQLSPKPGLGDNIESSRLMIRKVKSLGNLGNMELYALETGAYIITNIQYCVAYANGFDRHPSFGLFNGPTANVIDMTAWLGSLQHLQIPNFKFYPSIFAIAYNVVGNDRELQYGYLVNGCENYTWVDDETLGKMHLCAWLSMFHVDGVAMIKNSLL